MPLITIKLFEGRTQAQKKKGGGRGFLKVLEEELGSKPEHNWVIFDDTSRDEWFVGPESQTEIDERRKKEHGTIESWWGRQSQGIFDWD